MLSLLPEPMAVSCTKRRAQSAHACSKLDLSRYFVARNRKGRPQVSKHYCSWTFNVRQNQVARREAYGDLLQKLVGISTPQLGLTPMVERLWCNRFSIGRDTNRTS